VSELHFALLLSAIDATGNEFRPAYNLTSAADLVDAKCRLEIIPLASQTLQPRGAYVTIPPHRHSAHRHTHNEESEIAGSALVGSASLLAAPLSSNAKTAFNPPTSERLEKGWDAVSGYMYS